MMSASMLLAAAAANPRLPGAAECVEAAAALIMPPHRQEGLQADVGGLPMSDLCGSDRAYNVELSWLAFNWRVLSLASAVSHLHGYHGLTIPALHLINCNSFIMCCCRRDMEGQLQRSLITGLEE